MIGDHALREKSHFGSPVESYIQNAIAVDVTNLPVFIIKLQASKLVKRDDHSIPFRDFGFDLVDCQGYLPFEGTVPNEHQGISQLRG